MFPDSFDKSEVCDIASSIYRRLRFGFDLSTGDTVQFRCIGGFAIQFQYHPRFAILLRYIGGYDTVLRYRKLRYSFDISEVCDTVSIAPEACGIASICRRLRYIFDISGGCDIVSLHRRFAMCSIISELSMGLNPTLRGNERELPLAHYRGCDAIHRFFRNTVYRFFRFFRFTYRRS